MTTAPQKAYRFATRQHWAACLVDGLTPRNGGLSPSIALGLHAVDAGVAGPLTGVALDAFDRPLWRTAEGAIGWRDDFGAIQGPIPAEWLANSPRFVLDRRWLWAFTPDEVRRHDADTLAADRTLTLAELDAGDAPLVRILDIAGDGRDGLWVLVERASGVQALVRIDGCDDVARPVALPCGMAAARQIAAVDRGDGVVFLGSDDARLWRLDPASGTQAWSLSPTDLIPCWTVNRLASNAHDRLALGGRWSRGGETDWRLALLNSDGGLAQPPLTDLFPEAPATQVHDLALGRDLVVLATDRGLLRLDASEDTGAAGSLATVVTPALHSPVTANGRGWLRAEVDISLPRGAALEVRFASTDDPALVERAQILAASRDLPEAGRIGRLWSLLDAEGARSGQFVIPGEGRGPGTVDIPLFAVTERWLWVGLELQTPAGVDPPSLTELRVLYPEVSLMEHIPSIFHGEKNDPGLTLRRLVGVLETTTQDIDRRIQEAASKLDPGRTDAQWLDHLAAWLGLPWHAALPESAKRALLARARTLQDGRGRRAGLQVLLDALLAPGRARIVDVTADFPALRLGGGGNVGSALPGLIAGVPRTLPVLGGKAVLGKARLGCAGAAIDPLAVFAPEVRLELTTTSQTRAAIAPILADLLADYAPAGVRITVRWREATAAELGDDDDGLVLGGEGPGRLGGDSFIGRTVLSGRPGGLGDHGIGMDLRLR